MVQACCREAGESQSGAIHRREKESQEVAEVHRTRFYSYANI